MANILAVDDDGDLRALIAETLGRDGHFVRTLDSGSRIGEAHCRWADLILLDLLMPGEDGPAACRRIRAMTDAPILFLTALNGEADVLEALGSGGDDYLTKPFRIAELRARVAAHLRRQRRPVSHRLVRGGVAFDLAAGTAEVEGRPVGLTRGEYALCRVLALHAGQTFGKERLYEEAFGFEWEADRRRDQLLTRLTHQLKTPLAAVLASAELLAEEDLTPAQQEKAQTILRRAGEMQQTAARLRAMTLGARRKARD